MPARRNKSGRDEVRGRCAVAPTLAARRDTQRTFRNAASLRRYGRPRSPANKTAVTSRRRDEYRCCRRRLHHRCCCCRCCCGLYCREYHRDVPSCTATTSPTTTTANHSERAVSASSCRSRTEPRATRVRVRGCRHLRIRAAPRTPTNRPTITTTTTIHTPINLPYPSRIRHHHHHHHSSRFHSLPDTDRPTAWDFGVSACVCASRTFFPDGVGVYRACVRGCPCIRTYVRTPTEAVAAHSGCGVASAPRAGI